jgi:hypothetical protein
MILISENNYQQLIMQLQSATAGPCRNAIDAYAYNVLNMMSKFTTDVINFDRLL